MAAAVASDQPGTVTEVDIAERTALTGESAAALSVGETHNGPVPGTQAHYRDILATVWRAVRHFFLCIPSTPLGIPLQNDNLFLEAVLEFRERWWGKPVEEFNKLVPGD
ncbi:MAG TPA: hypothetical protein VD833_13105 [Vicinamibacterales bacterium]|nr:hypothetical protein [Vicinamibacterales bacterium]